MDNEIKYTTAFSGAATLWVTLFAALFCIIGYVLALRNPDNRLYKNVGRAGYTLAGLSMIAAFGLMCFHIYERHYIYKYVFEHTGNELEGWYRLAATWSGQEGSFGLWAVLTAVIGFLVLRNAGRYEARIMPFYVSILAFLSAILIKQSPFLLIPPPTAKMLAETPGIIFPFPEGLGLNPSLANYWMTIHPPTIFFGFASLGVLFVYSVAALIWKDYDGWSSRVMPYAALSCATLGGGLMMGGYWAYETQGWHGFWAWDPVENASFFPWLAVTALMHGLVVQKNRGGMARTNTFLGILSFTLFLIGTFLTRSGALSSKDASGVLLSVHAFANMESTALRFLVAMLAFYGGGGLILWFVRLRSMPVKKTTGETVVSRDFAMYMSVMLMLIGCAIITLGTTTPLWKSWLHQAPSQPQAAFYNKVMIPLSLLTALFMGFAPWVAWRNTSRETFLKKLTIPWYAMIAFGFFMVMWVMSAQVGMEKIHDVADESAVSTLASWNNSRVLQRLTVVTLASLGFFAALSNAMLAYRVFRAKPLSAGGWLAHVGIGLLIIGAVVSNTYERTQRVTLSQGDGGKEVFGYKIAFEGMTGKVLPERPLNPDYDYNNSIRLRITPPEGESGSADGSKTFLIEPRWFVHNMKRAESEEKLERMIWPSIVKYFGHDFYVGVAGNPELKIPSFTLPVGGSRAVGDYVVTYEGSVGEPGKFMGAKVIIANKDGSQIRKAPLQVFSQDGSMHNMDNAIPELPDENGNPSAVYLGKLDPATKSAELQVSLPGTAATWEIPLSVTYKPWVNLVWIGVVISVLGIFIAMIRRIIEARKINDDIEGDKPEPDLQVWDLPESGIAGAAHLSAGASPIIPHKPGKLRPTGK